MRHKIPKPVIAVVGEVVGHYYYSHNKLNTLFMEAGAPGDPPEGSCVNKCVTWLMRTNEDASVDPLKILGDVIFQVMEKGGVGPHYNWDETEEGQKRIRRILARAGLSYHEGGIVLAGGQAPPVATLNDVLRQGDLPALEIEFKRALDSLESDPPAAATSACSILESLFRVILDEEGVALPKKKTIKPLWSAVQDLLVLNPASVSGDDMRRVLSGLTSVVDGIGALRTHAGSAHGHGSQGYSLAPRHARLTVHAAHTLCLFLIETWEAH